MQAVIEQSTDREIKRRNRPSVTPTGIIPPGEMWHLSKAMEATGWGDAAFRKARQNGLTVIYTGGRAFIETDELIRYLKSQRTTQAATVAAE